MKKNKRKKERKQKENKRKKGKERLSHPENVINKEAHQEDASNLDVLDLDQTHSKDADGKTKDVIQKPMSSPQPRQLSKRESTQNTPNVKMKVNNKNFKKSQRGGTDQNGGAKQDQGDVFCIEGTTMRQFGVSEAKDFTQPQQQWVESVCQCQK